MAYVKKVDTALRDWCAHRSSARQRETARSWRWAEPS